MRPIDDLGDGLRDGQPTSARAPSKLNCPASVPITAPTLTAVRTAEPLYAREAHATVVAEVHALLPHTSAVASEFVAVGSTVTKLSPLIVTVPLPLGTALAATLLTTGAAQAMPVRTAIHSGVKGSAPSKLKISWPVPDTTATVTLATMRIFLDSLDKHASVVADVHDDEKHNPTSPLPAPLSPTVAVCSPTPKLRPEMVTRVWPDSGMFSSTEDAVAESKLKIGRPVPGTEATVTDP